jgi:hypothetical protein
MAILTDSNSPYKFEAPWHAFEFAFHVIEVQADLVIISMAWLTREEGRMFSRMPSEVSVSQPFCHGFYVWNSRAFLTTDFAA